MNTSTPPPSMPPSIKAIGIKGPLVAIPFLIAVACTVVAAAMGKITPEIAGLILMALGFPSAVGLKTVPQMMTALVAELQRQLASMPPPPITSIVPPPPGLPTGTDHPTDIVVTIPPKEDKP